MFQMLNSCHFWGLTAMCSIRVWYYALQVLGCPTFGLLVPELMSSDNICQCYITLFMSYHYWCLSKGAICEKTAFVLSHISKSSNNDSLERQPELGVRLKNQLFLQMAPLNTFKTI